MTSRFAALFNMIYVTDLGIEDGYEGDVEPKLFVAEPKPMDEMKVEVPAEIITPASPTSEEGTTTDEVATPTTIPDEDDYEESNKPTLNGNEVEERLIADNQGTKLESNKSNSLFSVSNVIIGSKPESLEKLDLETGKCSILY